MENYMIETRELSKTFNKQEVVKGLSPHVRECSVYGLLGPNGAGKSTTLKMFTGLLRPTSGEILFRGEPWRRHHLEEIGALIESPSLYDNLTARENLEGELSYLDCQAIGSKKYWRL